MSSNSSCQHQMAHHWRWLCVSRERLQRTLVVCVCAALCVCLRRRSGVFLRHFACLRRRSRRAAQRMMRSGTASCILPGWADFREVTHPRACPVNPVDAGPKGPCLFINAAFCLIQARHILLSRIPLTCWIVNEVVPEASSAHNHSITFYQLLCCSMWNTEKSAFIFCCSVGGAGWGRAGSWGVGGTHTHSHAQMQAE